MIGTTSQGGKPPGNPPQTTARNSQGLLLCQARWSRAIVFETQGGTRNRTRDLPKKGSAFIMSSDHWTIKHGTLHVDAVDTGGTFATYTRRAYATVWDGVAVLLFPPGSGILVEALSNMRMRAAWCVCR